MYKILKSSPALTYSQPTNQTSYIGSLPSLVTRIFDTYQETATVILYLFQCFLNSDRCRWRYFPLAKADRAIFPCAWVKWKAAQMPSSVHAWRLPR